MILSGSNLLNQSILLTEANLKSYNNLDATVSTEDVTIDSSVEVHSDVSSQISTLTPFSVRLESEPSSEINQRSNMIDLARSNIVQGCCITTTSAAVTSFKLAGMIDPLSFGVLTTLTGLNFLCISNDILTSENCYNNSLDFLSGLLILPCIYGLIHDSVISGYPND